MEQIAALRAEWLARLADAIEGAQRLAWQLRTNEGASTEARQLYGRLEAARMEIESLRGIARNVQIASDPDWLHKLGWSASLLDPAD